MSSDPTPGGRSGHGRLWTDPREGEEHTPWLAPKRAAGPRYPPLRPAGPPGPPVEPDDDDERAILRRRRLLGILVGTAVAALLIGAGVLGASLFSGGDNAALPAALPVVGGAAPADQRSRSIRAIYATAKNSIVPVRVQTLTGGGSG